MRARAWAEGESRARGRPQRAGAGASGVLALILLAAVASGCESPAPEETITLEAMDSVLVELGGKITADLDRGRRWRMISSIGPGLPPSDFRPEELPEPGSRGAGLLQVYCVQCHWLPTPQMHSADEWQILVRRNLFRARTLKNRLGGPLTRGMIGDVLMAGLQAAELPSPEEVDTLLAYLRRNALPTASPGELTDGPGRELFTETCSMCHEPPSPKAHTAAGWDEVVRRMRAYRIRSDLEPLTERQWDEISGYLRGLAVR